MGSLRGLDLYEISARAPGYTERVRIIAPSQHLAEHVRDFVIVELAAEATRLRLPELGLVLGVRYGGFAELVDEDAAVRVPDLVLTGMQLRARRMRTSRGGVVLARFTPAGAARFFAPPMHELLGQSLALDDVVSASDAARLHARVCEATSDRARVDAVEGFLMARLQRGRDDALALAAVRAVTNARGSLAIDELARSLSTSQDRLEKRFRRAVGMTPKRFASLVRLRAALDAYRPGTSLARLAVEAGYYDESHFHRELRAVVGDSPRRFFASRL